MPVFLEKFAFPVLVGVFIGVIVLNPLKLDRQQQFSLGIAILALAYFAGHTVFETTNRPQKAGESSGQSSSGVPIPATPPSPQAQVRVFTSKTVRELLLQYEGSTILQADSLMKPYKGQWIEVKGSVLQLIPDASGVTVVAKSQPSDLINARFDKKWESALLRLKTGDVVTIRGKIGETQNGQQLYLLECDF